MMSGFVASRITLSKSMTPSKRARCRIQSFTWCRYAVICAVQVAFERGMIVAPTMLSLRAWTRSMISVMPAMSWSALTCPLARSFVPSKKTTLPIPVRSSTSRSRRWTAAGLPCPTVTVTRLPPMPSLTNPRS